MAVVASEVAGGLVPDVYRDIKQVFVEGKRTVIRALKNNQKLTRLVSLERVAQDILSESCEGWRTFTEGQLGTTIFKGSLVKPYVAEPLSQSAHKFLLDDNAIVYRNKSIALGSRLVPARLLQANEDGEKCVNIYERLTSLSDEISEHVGSALRDDRIKRIDRRHDVVRLQEELKRRIGLYTNYRKEIAEAAAAALAQFDSMHRTQHSTAAEREYLDIYRQYFLLTIYTRETAVSLGVTELTLNSRETSERARNIDFGFEKFYSRVPQVEVSILEVLVPLVAVTSETILQEAVVKAGLKTVRLSPSVYELQGRNLFERRNRVYRDGRSEDIVCARNQLDMILSRQFWGQQELKTDFRKEDNPLDLSILAQSFSTALGLKRSKCESLLELYSNRILNRFSSRRGTLHEVLNRRYHRIFQAGADVLVVYPEHNAVVLDLRSPEWDDLATQGLQQPCRSVCDEAKIRRVADVLLACDYGREPSISEDALLTAKAPYWRDYARS